MPKIGSKSGEALRPFWTTTDGEVVRLYQGDVLSALRRMPAKAVQCIVTSPPYWGLRAYLDESHEHKTLELGSESAPDCLGWARGENCAEKDWHSACHVCRMVLVCRELRRVLRDDGTFWLNYGDSYASGSRPAGDKVQGNPEFNLNRPSRALTKTPEIRMTESGLPSGNLVGVPWRVALALQADGWILRQDVIWHKPGPMPESVRNRCTKAHEYVFLFVKRQGYYYDAEAVREAAKSSYRDTDFLPNSSKDAADDTEVKTAATGASRNGRTGEVRNVTSNKRSAWSVDDEQALLAWMGANAPEALAEFLQQSGNKPDVWRISSQGYEGAHFATFPQKLIEPCILAGTSEYGACKKCGAPWRRVISAASGGTIGKGGWTAALDTAVSGMSLTPVKNKYDKGDYRPGETLGWQPSCTCHGTFVEVDEEVTVIRRVDRGVDVTSVDGKGRDHSQRANRHGKDSVSLDPNVETEEVREIQKVSRYVSDLPLDDHPTRPCIVLDPFMGSGTTAVVSIANDRYCWGIELSEKYLRNNAIPRITGELFSRPALSHLIPRK